MGVGTRNAEGERILEFGDAWTCRCATHSSRRKTKLITCQSGGTRSMIDDGQENRLLSSEGCKSDFK